MRNQWLPAVPKALRKRLKTAGLGWLAGVTLLLVPVRLAARGGIQVENTTWVPAIEVGTSNCQRLRDTLDSLPTSPDQVVRLTPGLYFCGSTTLYVPSHVTLEGSGFGTIIGSYTDNVVAGVVHPIGRAVLSRLSVENYTISPVNAAIAVSVLDFPAVAGSPTLVDVNARVVASSGTAYPLWIGVEDVSVEGGSFSGGDIRVTGSNHTFTLTRSALEGLDADATITVDCSFNRLLTTGATLVSGC